MTIEPVAHWGSTDPDLLFEPERYGPYAAAHHIAGHHWARLRLDMPRGPAGLRLQVVDDLLPPLERERASVVEATAVLIEALAIEAAVLGDEEVGPGASGQDGVGFGIAVDIDWVLIREHAASAHHDARVRGCTGAVASVSALLRTEGWLSITGRKILRAWYGIAGLADALGRGRVLEPDEVVEVLGR